MPELSVDVLIAVHDDRRAVSRAVASALTTNRCALRVSVICHNIPKHSIEVRLGRLLSDPRVRLLELSDGVRSPAGPFNLGLSRSCARYVSIMGSDDELEAGAIDGWLAVAERDNADVVIPRMRHSNGKTIPTPPIRPGHTRQLDGVMDRLSYRSSPLGLISRARFGGLRLTEGMGTGEDLEFTSRLWFSGASVSYANRAPSYIVHDDDANRVTLAPRAVHDELMSTSLLTQSDWIATLSLQQQISWAVKTWRINFFGSAFYRSQSAWSRTDRIEMAHYAEMLRNLAPSALARLSIADRALVDALLDIEVPDEELNRLARRRRQFLHPRAWLTKRLRWLSAREAPPRMIAATLLAGLTVRRRADPRRR